MRRGWLVSSALAMSGLFVTLGAPASAVAQGSGTITGTVTDSSTRQGIAGAQIQVVGTTRGTLTNASGEYTIGGVPAGTVTVRAQRIGYARADRRITVTAAGRQTLNFALGTVASQLSSVVVTGYGETSRRDVSSSVSRVTGEEVQGVPLAGVDAALQGKVPGVQIIQNAGNPGVGITVRVRGSSSLSASNQPLYVIDGVPMIREDYSQLDVGGQDITAVTGISPNDIESIDVLKDAAAAAIYGSRASNGVIMITTKRGRPGKARVSFGTYYGLQKASRKVRVLTAKEYLQYMNDATCQDDKIYTGNYCDTTDPNSYGPNFFGDPNSATLKNTDWQEAIFRQAPVSDSYMGIQGGLERITYALSGSWFRQQGIVIGSGYDRGTGRVNLDFNVNDRLSFRSSLGLGRENNQRNENDNTINGVVTNAIANQPYVPVRNADGTFTSPNDGLDYSNAVAIGTLNNAETRSYRGLGNVEAIYNLSSAFRLNGRVGYDLLSLRDIRWDSPQIIGTYAAGAGGTAEYGTTTANRWLTEAFLTYEYAKGLVNNLQIVGGGSAEWNSNEFDYMRGEGFGSEDFRYPGNAGKITFFDGGKSGNNLVSAFTRANLNVLDRYLVTGSVRVDGSSRFGANQRYGVFPAISAGWNLSSEGFASPIRRLGDLKLRASFGLTGNQGIGDDFASLGRFGKANYSGIPGIATSTLANPELRWEQTAEFDVGLDFDMLGGRVALIMDWYNKRTTDLLVQRPVTATSGVTTIWENVGNIENKGLEFGVTTINIEPVTRSGLRWETNFNISTLDNKVTKLFRNEPFTSGIRGVNRIAVGVPLGAYYVLKFKRVDPATGNAEYVDTNGDSTVNAKDRVIAGSPHPDYWGGLRNRLEWNGFDVNSFFQFSQGNKIFNAIRIFSDDGGYYNDNKFADVLTRWQKPGDITNQPRASYDGLSNARQVSDRYIEDGSYVRMQELTLGYRLPARWSGTASLAEARFYVSGVNLATWSKFSGYNPDVNSNGSSANTSLGTEFYAYPIARTWRVGLTGSW